MYKYQTTRLTRIFLAFIFILLSTSAHAGLHSISASNFTMLDPTGSLIGGATDVNGSFEDTLICSAENCTDISMTLAWDQTFFYEPWTAHDIRVYGPGSYIFDTDCTGADIAAGITNCGDGPFLNLTVGPNQLGAHMLLDWAVYSDFDVVVLWDYDGSFGAPIYDGSTTPEPGDDDPTQTPERIWNLVSRDGDSDGIRGIAMVDGTFPDFSANFNLDMEPPLSNPNSLPVAYDDNRSVLTDTPIIIDVVNNDTDVEDGSPPPVPPAEVIADAVSNQGFTITNNGDGTVTYSPTGGFTGTDAFQYSLLDSDGLVSTSPATVTVTVSGVANQVPVASDPGGLNTNEDTSLLIDAGTVATDPDADPSPLTFHLFDVNTLQGGAVTADDPLTTLTYTPPADFFGNDSLMYQVTDGADDSNIATLTITVNSVNDPLVCTEVSFKVDTNTSFAIDIANDLLSTCTDTENDPISLDSFTQPVIVGSMVTFDGDNTLTYTPATDYEGLDSFTYRATDGTDFDVRTITLDVAHAQSNLTFLAPDGVVLGGTNDVIFDWDSTTNNDEVDYTNNLNFNMSIRSHLPQPFFGLVWTAHDIRVFGPGAYSFDTGCTMNEIRTTGCPAGSAATSGPTITMTVGQGQYGAHILLDWGTSTNIDIVNVWDVGDVWDTYGATPPVNELWLGPAGVAPDPGTTWELVSRDVNGDLINGAPMLDGSFPDFYANFNLGPTGYVPPPDTDGDGISDDIDNCTLIPNPGQCDRNGDGYGNRCDADFNNDGIVDTLDVGPLVVTLGTANPVTDITCDGIVNRIDVFFFKNLFGSPPGPSALVP